MFFYLKTLYSNINDRNSFKGKLTYKYPSFKFEKFKLFCTKYGIMYCNFMIIILKSNSFLTFHYSNASMSHKCLQISNDEIRARNFKCWISISKLCNPKLIIDKSGQFQRKGNYQNFELHIRMTSMARLWNVLNFPFIET